MASPQECSRGSADEGCLASAQPTPRARAPAGCSQARAKGAAAEIPSPTSRDPDKQANPYTGPRNACFRASEFALPPVQRRTSYAPQCWRLPFLSSHGNGLPSYRLEAPTSAKTPPPRRLLPSRPQVVAFPFVMLANLALPHVNVLLYQSRSSTPADAAHLWRKTQPQRARPLRQSMDKRLESRGPCNRTGRWNRACPACRKNSEWNKKYLPAAPRETKSARGQVPNHDPARLSVFSGATCQRAADTRALGHRHSAP